MVGQAVGLLRRSRVLLALVAVELFWGFGMVTFESLLPVRLAEVVGDAGPGGGAARPGQLGGLAGLGGRRRADPAAAALARRRARPPRCCGSCRASRWSAWVCSPARSGC